MAGNLNLGHSYLITTVYFFDFRSTATTHHQLQPMQIMQQHPTQIHQPAWSTESQQTQQQNQNQQPQLQPQSLSSIAHVQEIHENNSEAVKSEFNQTNLSLTQSHNSSNDDFQHLFSSPLKFLAVLNENQHAGGGQREQQNIDFEATASDLGVVPFDVEDTYYNPLASSTPSVSQGPHILRKSNSLGIIQRRKRENVSPYFHIMVNLLL